MTQPRRVKKPAVVFADSMSDWWSDGVEWTWRVRAIEQMWQSPQHRFVVLTKHPERIEQRDVEGDRPFGHGIGPDGRAWGKWPPNAWLGVSITSGADWWRWEALAKLPERIHKFISAEPLLNVDVVDALSHSRSTPSWLVVGRQTGPGSELVDGVVEDDAGGFVNCYQLLREDCEDKGIPLFEKAGLPLQSPIRQMPHDLAAVFRKGLGR